MAAIKRHGGLTQVELAGITGLSPATVSNIVRELTAVSVLQTSPSTRSGRRASLVTFSRATGLAVGVHVSSHHLRIIVADVNRSVLSEKHMPLARDHRADNELNRMALLLSDMLVSIGSTLDDVITVGVAVDAPIVHGTGTVASRGLMRGWIGVDVADAVRARLKKPVVVDNAASLSALAETRLGVARDLRNVVYLDVGEHISAGFVLNGALFRGQHGMAGALGHSIVIPGGPPCWCGRRGCLNAVAGGRALLQLMEPAQGATRVGDIVTKAKANDPLSIRALSDAGTHIGIAVGNLWNTIDPEVVVIGGELAESGELLVSPIRQAMAYVVTSDIVAPTRIEQAGLGFRGAALGALLRAINEADMPNAVN